MQNARRFLPLLSLAIIIGGTYLAVQIGKGYRPTKDGLAGTGLLSANSFPDGAQVYIDSKLTTATDDTLNLPPGEYTVSIQKDGYIPWSKTILIEQELVTQTNASLFRSVPSLSPLTLSGAANINPSPDGQKIAFVVASASASTKNGLYILEISDSTLTAQKSPRQIVRNTPDKDFSQAQLLWSPDSTQILAHFPEGDSTSSNHIIPTDTTSDIETLPDVTIRLPIILADWEEEIANRETKQYALLPPEMQDIATQSAINVYFSPNEERMMYTATSSATIPPNLITAPLATNTQPEYRNIEAGNIYIYDLKEDRNYLVDTVSSTSSITKNLLLLPSYQTGSSPLATNSATPPSLDFNTFTQLQTVGDIPTTISNFKAHYSSLYVNNFQWFPDSSHILIVLDGKIDLIEYDSTNWITLYSGPFDDNFAYPWPDGTRIIVTTSLNPTSNQPANLYGIEVK